MGEKPGGGSPVPSPRGNSKIPEKQEKKPVAPGNQLVQVESADIELPEDAYKRWGNFPEAGRCPHCKSRIVSIVTSERSTLGQAFAFLLILYFGLPGLMWLPLLTPVLNDIVHSCPRCLNVIVKKNAMACPGRGQVHTIKIGSCAFMVKQSYVYAALAVCSVLGGVFACVRYGYFDPFTVRDVPVGRPSPVKWEQFLRETGPKAFGRDMGKAYLAYQKYDGKLFTWEGRVRRIQEQVSPWNHDSRAIVTDMFPNEAYAYAVLLFNSSMDDKVVDLLPGDYIRFNATMFEWGRRGMPYALILRSVEEVDVLSSSPADHKDANSKLHHLALSLESVDLDALDEAEREALLSSFLNEILKLVREHPRDFPELTTSSVLAARFPALADHFRNHDIIEA
jgi:hypothetical protein